MSTSLKLTQYNENEQELSIFLLTVQYTDPAVGRFR